MAQELSIYLIESIRYLCCERISCCICSSFSNDVYDGNGGQVSFEEDEEEEEHIYRRLEDMVSEDHYKEFCYQVTLLKPIVSVRKSEYSQS